jgi:hypothetical protein
MSKNKMLYQKYHVEKADGTPCDPNAQYFVLRIDKDPHARVAVQAYADDLMTTLQGNHDHYKNNVIFAVELLTWLNETQEQFEINVKSFEVKPAP